MRYKHWLGLGASIILGMIFCIAGLGKILAQTELFESPFVAYLDLLNLYQVRFLFTWLPYVELVLGLLLIIGFATKIMTAFASLLVVAFITNNGWAISQNMGFEPCGCLGIFGRFFQNKLSTEQSLYLDIAMLALILITLLCYQRRFTDISPWFLKETRS